MNKRYTQAQKGSTELDKPNDAEASSKVTAFCYKCGKHGHFRCQCSESSKKTEETLVETWSLSKEDSTDPREGHFALMARGVQWSGPYRTTPDQTVVKTGPDQTE
ncbi:unnamed protein product [Linum trigynum]|uniref:CCHC-type domain-containing protein n=1 Tax=Linum trigynum TaxID=586398 RepID=A0AAV2E9Q6_9ROSI